MTQKQLAEKLALYYKLADIESSISLQNYLNHCVIDCNPTPTRFGLVREPWQDNIFGPLTARLEYLAGINPTEPTGPRCFWFTLPKGHDKSSGEARLINFLLAYSRRMGGLRIYAAAKDRDQAKIISDSMRTELTLNPWLDKHVKMYDNNAVGRGGTLKVLTYDPSGSQGAKPHFLICDELTCWPKQDFYTSLASGITKNPISVMVIITNAGVRGSWQWELLQEAKAHPELWHVFEAPEGKTLASWMKPEEISILRKQFPPSEAARLYDNIWVESTEDLGYVTRVEVSECEALGKVHALNYVNKGTPGVDYFAAIDYGPKKDRTVMCVMHLDKKSGLFMVDKMDVLQGSADKPVQISEVESWMEEVDKNFNQPQIVVDAYQMESTLQKYKNKLFLEKFQFRGGKGNYQMAELLRSLIINKRIAWYAGCGAIYHDNRLHTLVDEFSELIIQRMSYGYRFNHESGKHDDRVVTLGMCVMLANKNQFTGFVLPKDEDSQIITLKDPNLGGHIPTLVPVGVGIKPFGVS